MKIIKKLKKKIKKIFKTEEIYEMPYERGVIVFSENALETGIEDDLNKWIFIYNGDEIVKKLPYSKSMVKVLIEEEHIPIYDATKQDKFQEGEEIVPSEVFYETI